MFIYLFIFVNFVLSFCLVEIIQDFIFNYCLDKSNIHLVYFINNAVKKRLVVAYLKQYKKDQLLLRSVAQADQRFRQSLFFPCYKFISTQKFCVPNEIFIFSNMKKVTKRLSKGIQKGFNQPKFTKDILIMDF